MYLPTFIQGWETLEVLRSAPYGTQYKIRNFQGELSLLRISDIPATLDIHRNLSMQGPYAFNYYCQTEINKFQNSFRIMCDFSNSPYVLKPKKHIVQPFSSCNGFAFFAMYEFLPTLDNIFIERSVENAVAILRDLCNGLRPFHMNGLLYGNILPSNIFYGNNFKLGEIIPYSPPSAFTPPEAFNGGPIGFHSDIFSVCAVVAWFLTAALPPHSFSMLNGGIGYIISKACAMNPMYRYRNIDELLADLNSIYPVNTNRASKGTKENEKNRIYGSPADIPSEISSEENLNSHRNLSQDENISGLTISAENSSQNSEAGSYSLSVDTDSNSTPEKSSQADDFLGSTMPITNMDFGSTSEKSSQADDFLGSTMPISNMGFGSTSEKSSQADDFLGSTMPISNMDFGSTSEKSSQSDDFFGSTMPISNMGFGSTSEKSSQSDDFFGSTMPISNMGFGSTSEKSSQADDFLGSTMPISNMDFGSTSEKSSQADDFLGSTMPISNMGFGSTSEKSSQADDFLGSTMPITNMGFGSTSEKSSQSDDFFGSTMPISNMDFGSTSEKSSQSDDFFGSTMPISNMDFGSTSEKSSQSDDFFGSTMPISNMNFGSTSEKSSQSDDFFGSTMPISDMDFSDTQ